MLKGWESFIVVDNKSCVNTRERNTVSALNIIGTSIDRAAKITAIAAREEFRNQESTRRLLFYAWVDKEEPPVKIRQNRLIETVFQLIIAQIY